MTPENNREIKDKLKQIRIECLSSFLHFTKVMYRIKTGRNFEISAPAGRESHYITISKELTNVVKGVTQDVIINVPPRYGKAIYVNTPILTKNGWKNAIDVTINDELLGSNGWTKVTGVFPQGKLSAKEVFFTDGQSVICNDEHLWNVCDRYTPRYKTYTTKYIEQTLYEADGRKHWKIPLIDPNYEKYATPLINPYLLGCWLGDGHSNAGRITTMDNEILISFKDDGHILTKQKCNKISKASTYNITKNGFQTLLRQLNLLNNKHIPDYCIFWDKNSRIELLQGLMDTDGTCGKNGQVSFTNTNKNIIEKMGELINSLGGIYRVYTRRCGTQTLNLRLPDDIKPFKLKRKQQYVSSGIKCSPRRFIDTILESDPCEMICFTVDAEDHLFAIGKGFLLTHNSTLAHYYVAWTMAMYPDSNFLYISYSHELAAKQTQEIRSIMTMRDYRNIFNVNLKEDSQAKHSFETTAHGSVYAAGAGGTITGRGAGVRGQIERFSGAIIIDDIHKPDEATSDVIREGIIDWYYNTMISRKNNAQTPIIYIGQRVHEADLAAHLHDKGGFKLVSIPSIDRVGNVLHPGLHTKSMLEEMEKRTPYVFAAQYQQNPQPAGGGIFKPEWFYQLDEDPDIVATFITADTAETDKTYNDATVFSFWGVYKIKNDRAETEEYGLHWLDCREVRVEPKDLESEFMDFYTECCRYHVSPMVAAIEKKSTGVTLVSILKSLRGLHIKEVERTRNSGSKSERFLMIQPYLAAKLISFTHGKSHVEMCIEHMRKITANNSHAHDDIADTCVDAVILALIDKVIVSRIINPYDYSQQAKSIMSGYNKINALRKSAYKL